MSKSKSTRKPQPTQAGTVIRRSEAPKQFGGPSTFRGTGTFAGNEFKAGDKGSPR